MGGDDDNNSVVDNAAESSSSDTAAAAKGAADLADPNVTPADELEAFRKSYLDADNRSAPGAAQMDRVGALGPISSRVRRYAETHPHSKLKATAAASEGGADGEVRADHAAMLREFALPKLVKTVLRSKCTIPESSAATIDFFKAFIDMYIARLHEYSHHLERVIDLLRASEAGSAGLVATAEASATWLKGLNPDAGFHTSLVLIMDNDATFFLTPGAVTDVLGYDLLPAKQRDTIVERHRRLAVAAAASKPNTRPPTTSGGSSVPAGQDPLSALSQILLQASARQQQDAASGNHGGSYHSSAGASPAVSRDSALAATAEDEVVELEEPLPALPETPDVWAVLPDPALYKWASFYLVDVLQHFGTRGGYDAIFQVIRGSAELQQLAAQPSNRQHAPLLDGTQLPFTVLAAWLELIANVDSFGYLPASKQLHIGLEIEDLIPKIVLTPDTAALRKLNKSHYEQCTRILTTMCASGRLLSVCADTLRVPSYDDSQEVAVSKFELCHGAEWVERLQVMAAVHYFSCGILEKRLYGITCLSEIVKLVSAADNRVAREEARNSTPAPSGSVPKEEVDKTKTNQERNNGASSSSRAPPTEPKFLRSPFLCAYLTGHHSSTSSFLNVLFGPSAHVQLIQRSTDIVAFLCTHDAVTGEVVDLMWSGATASGVHTDVTAAILTVIGDCAPSYRRDALLGLSSLFEKWYMDLETIFIGDVIPAVPSQADFMRCITELAYGMLRNSDGDSGRFKNRFTIVLWKLVCLSSHIKLEDRHLLTKPGQPSRAALFALTDLTRRGCFAGDEEIWIKAIVEAIVARKPYAGMAFEFLGSLLVTYPSQPTVTPSGDDAVAPVLRLKESLNSRVARLQNEWGLLDPVFFEEIHDFKASARQHAREMASAGLPWDDSQGNKVLNGCLPYVEEIRRRLDFFSFAMSHYGFLIAPQRFVQLFDLCGGPGLADDPLAEESGPLFEIERHAFFDFCVGSRSPVQNGFVPLDDQSTTRLFITRFSRADVPVAGDPGQIPALGLYLLPDQLSLSAWYAFKRLMCDSNVIFEKCAYSSDPALDIACDSKLCLPENLHGYPTLWSIVLQAERNEVASAATDFLLNLHKNTLPSFSFEPRDLRTSFLQLIFEKFATVVPRSTSQKDPLALRGVRRILEVLSRYSRSVEDSEHTSAPSHARGAASSETDASAADRPLTIRVRVSSNLYLILKPEAQVAAKKLESSLDSDPEYDAEITLQCKSGSSPRDLQKLIKDLVIKGGFGPNGTSDDVVLSDERGNLLTADDKAEKDEPEEPAGEADAQSVKAEKTKADITASADASAAQKGVRDTSLATLGTGFNNVLLYARPTLDSINAYQAALRALADTTLGIKERAGAFSRALALANAPTYNRPRDQVSGSELPANRRFDQLLKGGSKSSVSEDDKANMTKQLQGFCDVSEAAAQIALDRASWDLNNAVVLLTEDDAKRDIIRAAQLVEEAASKSVAAEDKEQASPATDLSQAQKDLPFVLLSHNSDQFSMLFSLLSLEGTPEESRALSEIRSVTWDMLMHMPTHGEGKKGAAVLAGLVEEQNPYTILYSLQVIEKNTEASTTSATWTEQFVKEGGAVSLCSLALRSAKSIAAFPSFSDPMPRQWLGCLSLSLKLVLIIEQSSLLDLRSVVDTLFETISTLPDLLADAMSSSRVAADVIVYCLRLFGFASLSSQSSAVQLALSKLLSVLTASSMPPDLREEAAAALIAILSVDREKDNVLLNELLSRLPDVATTDPSIYGSVRAYFSVLCELLRRECTVSNFSGSGFAAELSSTLAHPTNWVAVFSVSMAAARARPFLEARRGGRTDEILCGLLRLCSISVRRARDLNLTTVAPELFHEFLFDVVPGVAHAPKCKSKASRQACLKLLVDVTRASGASLHDVLPDVLGMLKQDHYGQGGKRDDDSKALMPQKKRITRWDYHPSADDKSDCGFVGLRNLGNTCYMNSLVQQLFMTPRLRTAIMHTPWGANESSLLYQFQRLFAYLQESETAAYAPEGFTQAFKDWEGNSINVHQQQDVDEFLGLLFDRLEQVLPAGEKALFKQIFGGVSSNELRTIEPDFPYKSERKEDFMAFSIGIKGKASIEDALDAHVAPERMEGDNAYNVEQYDRKVAATRRTFVTKLPNTLMIHLRRFSFDYTTYRKMKVNDFCSFPRVLNMKKWSKEGILTAEGRANELDEEDQHADSYYQFTLRGVLVHSGGADAGHYYSYVKMQDGSGWVELNDSATTFFDGENDNVLATECFGGVQQVTTWDSYHRKYVTNTYDRVRSAYMLLYERDVPEPEPARESLESTPNQVSFVSGLPKPLHDDVWLHNAAFLRDRQLFDASYFEFVVSLFEATCDRYAPRDNFSYETLDRLETPSEDQPELFPFSRVGDYDVLTDDDLLQLDRGGAEALAQVAAADVPATMISAVDRPRDWIMRRRAAMAAHVQAAQTLTRFVIEILFHAKDGARFIERAVRLLRRLCENNVASSRWFLLHELSRRERNLARGHSIKELLLECTNEGVRIGYAVLCSVVARCVAAHERYFLTEQEIVDVPSADAAPPVPSRARPLSVFVRWFDQLFAFLEDSRMFWRRFKQYFAVINCCGCLGPEFTTLFLERYKLFTTYDDYFMGRSTKAHPRRVSVMDRFNLPDLTTFLSLLETTIRGVDLQPPSTEATDVVDTRSQPPTALPPMVPVSSSELKEFFDKVFFTAMLEMDYERAAASRIMIHGSWENYKRSRWFLDILLSEISRGWLSDKLHIFLGMLTPILTECPDSLARVRTIIVLSPFAAARQYGGVGSHGYTSSSTPKGGLLAMAHEVSGQNPAFALHLVRYVVKVAARSPYAKHFLMRQPREVAWCVRLLESKLGLGDYSEVMAAERIARLQDADDATGDASAAQAPKMTYAEAAKKALTQQSESGKKPDYDEVFEAKDSTFDDTELLTMLFRDDVEDEAIVEAVWNLPATSRLRTAAELRRRLFTRTHQQLVGMLREALESPPPADSSEADQLVTKTLSAPIETAGAVERELELRESISKLQAENVKLKQLLEAYRLHTAADVVPANFMLTPDWQEEVEAAGGASELKFYTHSNPPPASAAADAARSNNRGIPITSTVPQPSPSSSPPSPPPPPLVDCDEYLQPRRSHSEIANLGLDHDDLPAREFGPVAYPGFGHDPTEELTKKQDDKSDATRGEAANAARARIDAADVAKARSLLDIVPTLSITAAVIALRRADGDLDMACMMCFDEISLIAVQEEAARLDAEGKGFNNDASGGNAGGSLGDSGAHGVGSDDDF